MSITTKIDEPKKKWIFDYPKEIQNLVVPYLRARFKTITVPLHGNEKHINWLGFPETITATDLKTIMKHENIEFRMVFFGLYEQAHGAGSGITALNGKLIAEHKDNLWGKTWELDLGDNVVYTYLEVENPTKECTSDSKSWNTWKDVYANTFNDRPVFYDGHVRRFFIKIPPSLSKNPILANLWTFGIVNKDGKKSDLAVKYLPNLTQDQIDSFNFNVRR